MEDWFPVFMLERWQSLHETSVRYLLSESGVEPPSWEVLRGLGVEPGLVEAVDLGYGWTKGWPPLREAIARIPYRGLVGAENIVVTAGGAAEANLITAMAYARPGSVVLLDEPSYMQLHGLVARLGARPLPVPRSREEGYKLPVERLVEEIRRRRPSLLYIVNPSNPTGVVTPLGELRELAREAAAAGTVLLVDEVYRGLEHSAPPAPTVLEAAVEEGALAVSTGSLSKAAGLPGLRIGWVAASTGEAADRLWAAKDYTSISPPRPSEALARAALGAWERLTGRARAVARRNLRLLRAALEGLPVSVFTGGAGAYVLLHLPAPGVAVAEHLLARHGLLAVPGEYMGAPCTLRVGLGAASEETAREAYRVLAGGLREALDELDESCDTSPV